MPDQKAAGSVPFTINLSYQTAILQPLFKPAIPLALENNPMKRIEEVKTKKQLASFIDFPHDLYKNDPNYVPELFIAQRDLLTPGKHPFHEHSSLRPFLAYDGDKIVGRICAIHNVNHNEFNQANDGFFGFFDCINDQETANLLFATAEKWLKEKGLSTMIGPVNFSTNEACGLLVEGYDKPPVLMMTYNFPYYLQLIEKAGLHKKADLLAYEHTTADYNDRSVRLMDSLQNRLKQKGIIIRKIDLKNFKDEVAKVHEVYNSAWDKNLGFVPMTKAEFEYLAKDMKLAMDPDYVYVAEHAGKIVGFSLTIPDLNQVLIKVKRGRLLPTGIFKLLLGKKKITGLRTLALGVVEGYRKMGIEAVFYGLTITTGVRKGVKTDESSWILEDNELMKKGVEGTGGKQYKRYRLFEKSI